MLGTDGGVQWAAVDSGEELRCAFMMGQHLLTGGSAGVVKIWDMKTASLKTTVTGAQGKPVEPISCLCPSTDGQSLVAGCDNGSVYVWSATM